MIYLSIQKLTQDLRKLNPEIDFDFRLDMYPATIIVKSFYIKDLVLPNGFHFNGSNEISDNSRSFKIMTEYEYMSSAWA